MAQLKFPDFAAESACTLNAGGTIITLSGTAISNHRTFANAEADANIDFDNGDTVAVDITDAGGDTATWTGTYDTTGNGTITVVTTEAAQGTLATESAELTVYSSVPGSWFRDIENNRLPISATTAVTGTDITGVSGTQYHLDISGITGASKNFTLPVPVAAGERIKVLLTAGDDAFELIMKGVATVTINGGSAATEWSRLLITGESVDFVSTSTTNWNVEHDGRIPCLLYMQDKSGTASHYANGTTTVPKFDTASVDVGNLAVLASDKATVRRAGDYLYMAGGSSDNVIATNERGEIYIRHNAVAVSYAMVAGAGNSRAAPTTARTITAAAGDDVDCQVYQNSGAAMTGETADHLAYWLYIEEQL